MIHESRTLNSNMVPFFLNGINTSGVKIRPVLQSSWSLFHKVEKVESWYCENNFNQRKQL